MPFYLRLREVSVFINLSVIYYFVVNNLFFNNYDIKEFSKVEILFGIFSLREKPSCRLFLVLRFAPNSLTRIKRFAPLHSLTHIFCYAKNTRGRFTPPEPFGSLNADVFGSMLLLFFFLLLFLKGEFGLEFLLVFLFPWCFFIPCCPCSLIGSIFCSFPGTLIQLSLCEISFLGAGSWVGINIFLPEYKIFFAMIFYLIMMCLEICSIAQSSLYFAASCPCSFNLICSFPYYFSLCCATSILIAYFCWIIKMGLKIQSGELNLAEMGMRWTEYGRFGVLMDICGFTIVHLLIMCIWSWTLPVHCLMGSALIPALMINPCSPSLCCCYCVIALPHLFLTHLFWSSTFQTPTLPAEQTCLPAHPWALPK